MLSSPQSLKGSEMVLTKVELTSLVRQAVMGSISAEAEKTLIKELEKKFEQEGLETFQERIVLAGYILYPDTKELRDGFIEEQLIRHRKLICGS